MKRFLVIALATVAVGFAGSSFAADDFTVNTGTLDAGADSVAAYPAGMAANGITASRHNVGGLGNYIAVASGLNAAGSALVGVGDSPTNGKKYPSLAVKTGEGGGASEVCVFCHTPHHTVNDSNATNNVGGYVGDYGNAPLWNRQGSAASYTAYGTTIGGSTMNAGAGTAGNAPGGTTLACMSCHDGITAIDNLVNGPGENAMADRWGESYGSANSQGFDLADVFDNSIGNFQIGQEERLNIGNGGTGNPFNWSATNANLSNDHPMSVYYSDGDMTVGPGNGGAPATSLTKRASLRGRTTTISSIDLASGLYFTDVGAYGTEMLANLSQNRWAIKGFISQTATIADLLREGKVECSSCHDPHFKNLSNADLVDNTTMGERYGDDGTAAAKIAAAATGVGFPSVRRMPAGFAKQDGLFLRRVGGNAGSGVCRTCHNK